jgi:hypothetical protein
MFTVANPAGQVSVSVYDDVRKDAKETDNEIKVTVKAT